MKTLQYMIDIIIIFMGSNIFYSIVGTNKFLYTRYVKNTLYDKILSIYNFLNMKIQKVSLDFLL